MTKHINFTRGFTLIELLVVIAIIGIFASVVFASLNSARTKGTASGITQEVNQYLNALELYAADHGGFYPNAAGAINTYYCLGNYPDDACGYNGTSMPENATLNTMLTPYIASLPAVGPLFPITNPTFSGWEGAVYGCAALSGSKCTTYSVGWLLPAAGLTCAKGATVIAGTDYTLCVLTH